MGATGYGQASSAVCGPGRVGFSLTVDMPVSGQITQASPDLGQHTDAVMRDLGFSDEEIAGFRAQKVIA